MSDDFTLLDIQCLKATPTAAHDEAAAEARGARLATPPARSTLQSPAEGALYYQASEALKTAINTALALEMPLLLAGEPGTGKTQVAWFVARAFALGHPLVLPVRSTTLAHDLLYQFDAVGDFRDANERAPAANEGALAANLPRPSRVRHIHPGPLWTALTSGSRPRVVLVDEIDKAPRDFPNDLLDALDRFEVPVPELARFPEAEVRAHFGDGLEHRDGTWWVVGDPARRRPIVIITTNSERRLPEPFLRRCVFHAIPFDEDVLKRAVAARPRSDFDLPTTVEEAARRSFIEVRKLDLKKRPSTAEYLAWLRVLARNPGVHHRVGGRLADLPFLEVLLKTKEDSEQLAR